MSDKKVHGWFVIVLKQHDDTMCGSDYHYTSWCIGNDKYCRLSKKSRIRKFPSYNQAVKEVISLTRSTSSLHAFEIVYLTTKTYEQDSKIDENLSCWLQIESEQDALEYDLNQQREKLAAPSEKVPFWDSTNFYSIFTR